MAESTRPGEVSYPDTNGSSKLLFKIPREGPSETFHNPKLTLIRIKNAVTNGPVVDHIKSEAARTEQELRELKNARVTPSTTTATGQHLTYYHSLLYSLLSWEQPRATAVSFATVVTFIFAARYLPLLRWFFKFIYVALGFTAAAELGGRLVLSQGLASSFRPRKYYTIPKETIEGVYEDLEQLLNFVLLEFQRILFAENIVHTVAAFAAAFSAYWLIKWLPFWGLSLIAVTIAYIGPLVYMNNREVIDAQIENIQEVVNSQAHQLKDLAEERTSHATGLMKQYVDDYSAKAQEYIGQRRSVSPQMTKVSTPEPVIKKEIDTEPVFKTTDFPEAPKEEPVAVKEEPVAVAESIEHPALNAEKEPLLAA